MSLKHKYDQWDQITESIRPIWNNTNQKVRGDTSLWKIIHAVSATPDLWQSAMDVVPIVRAQHEWLFKKNATKLDADLREIKNRIARGDPITISGKQEYNLPAFRSVMSIKDIWMDIKDNKRTIELPDAAPSVTDIFADTGVYDDDTEKQIELLKGLIAIYTESSGNPSIIRELIEHCLKRIDELKNPALEMVTVVEQFSANLSKSAPVDNSEEAIFDVACGQSKQLNALANIATRKIVYVIDSDPNPLVEDDVWFGQVEFQIPKEDYMLHQLGQTA